MSRGFTLPVRLFPKKPLAAPLPCETEPDTTETEPTPDPVTISDVTYEIRDGGYVVTGVTSADANRLAYVYYDKFINIDGWLFIPDMGAGTSEAKNVTYEMTVEENKITLSCNYDMYTENNTSVTLLVRGEDGWYFEDTGCMEVSLKLAYLFEDYLEKIKGK